MTKFDLLLCDPPWKYTQDNTGTNIASRHYGLMDQKDLNDLPVKDILNKKAAVLMWATGPKLDFAVETMKAWGLHYRGVAFVWVKTRKSDGVIINGQGVPPTFTKPTTEFLLLGTTKKAGRMIPLKKFNTAQVVLAPRGKHSEKPEVFREMVEKTFLEPYSKIELFSRKKVPGWTTLGNEIDGMDIKETIKNLAQNEENL